jgi:uncharacterized protein YndB with AHSA1/START domain
MATDSIEREIVIAAPVERVWEIVTQPEHLGRWFGDAGAEADGDVITMRWEEYGTAHLHVQHSEPPRHFAYRWTASGIPEGTPPTDGNSTLVEFTFEPTDGGTRLRVVESGFAGLDFAPDKQAELHAGNVEGWEHEFGHLERYAQTVAV